MRYLDDILILTGLIALGACIWQWFGGTATVAFAGTIMVILGVMLGLRGGAQ